MQAPKLLLISFIFSMAPAFAADEAERKSYSDLQELAISQISWPLDPNESQNWGEYNLVMQQAKLVLDDRQQTYETQYLAASIYIEYLMDFSDYDNARYYCQKFPPQTRSL